MDAKLQKWFTPYLFISKQVDLSSSQSLTRILSVSAIDKILWI